MTFTQYLNTIKIAAAIEKLRKNEMSITKIALECGFNTIRNFNRVFKKFTGYTPNSLPPDYVFLYRLQDGYGIDPTLNCTIVMKDPVCDQKPHKLP
jgi:AraC-like DNA-binding protein